MIEDNIIFTCDIKNVCIKCGKSALNKQKEFSRIETLWIGVIAGAVILLSIVGIIQYFVLRSHVVGLLLKDVWFGRPWWIWAPPLLFFIGLLIYVRIKIE